MHKLLTSKQAVADVVLLSKVPSICKVNILMLMQLEDSIPDEVIFDAVEDYMLRPDIYDAAWGGALHSSFIEKAIRQIKAKRIALGIKTDKVIL
jgi:hypothetical protein